MIVTLTIKRPVMAIGGLMLTACISYKLGRFVEKEKMRYAAFKKEEVNEN